MLKPITALTALMIGLSTVAPASAHFSQVFGPLKAQFASFSSSEAQVKMMCEGTSVTTLGSEWITLSDK